VIQNEQYRITLIESQYREIYLIRFYKPTTTLCKEIEKILPKEVYTVSLIEYDYHFNCPDEKCADLLYQFIKESYHLSYLKKPSLVLIRFPGSSYRSDPRNTKSIANRIYINKNDSKVPKIEYVAKRRWIRKNGIGSLLDCFLTSPSDIVKNSCFKSFNYEEIARRLHRDKMMNNISSRVIRENNNIREAYGFHAAYCHLKKFIPDIYRITYTPLHSFHYTFRGAVERLSFIK